MIKVRATDIKRVASTSCRRVFKSGLLSSFFFFLLIQRRTLGLVAQLFAFDAHLNMHVYSQYVAQHGESMGHLLAMFTDRFLLSLYRFYIASISNWERLLLISGADVRALPSIKSRAQALVACLPKFYGAWLLT